MLPGENAGRIWAKPGATSIGRKGQLPQSGQIAQPFADAEVARVVDGGLRAQGASLLVVLLDAAALVVDVQGGRHALGDHPGAKPARRPPRHPPREDQLHLAGPAQVQVLADDLLEEQPAPARAVQHLGQDKLRLQDGDRVGVAGRLVRGAKGVRQDSQPFAQQGRNARRIQAVGNRLHAHRVRTPQARPRRQGSILGIGAAARCA